MTTPIFDFGIAESVEDQPGYKTDAQIDRWHDGVLDALRHKPSVSEDADYLEGYAEGIEIAKVRPAEVARPEGYYHMPLGTFE